MKKILLLVALSTFGLFAQEAVPNIRPGFIVNKSVDKIQRSKVEGGKGVFSEWLDFQTGYEAYWSANSSLFANNLFPDSTVLVQYTSGLGSPWIHKVGQVFDMKALPLQVQYSTPFSRTESFQIDSIQIGVLYNRVNLSPTQFDTLIVEVVLPSSVNLSSLLQFSAASAVAANLTGGQSPVRFSELKWTYNTNSTPGVTAIYKVPIGDAFFADSTSNGLHFASIAANLPVPVPADSNLHGVFSVNYSFKPGYSWNLNSDTLGVSINSLRFLSWELNGQNTYPNYLGDLQTAYILPIDVRYNQAGSWNGRFIPSYAYMGSTSSFAYENHLAFVKISQTNSIGIDDLDQTSVNFYPNPASQILNITVPKGSSTVVLRSALGQVVKKDIIDGIEDLVLDISNLEPGIYFIEIDGVESRSKVIKL